MNLSLAFRPFVFLATVAAIFPSAAAVRAQAGGSVDMRLAFSFSDVPGEDGKLYTSQARTERVLATLKQGHVTQAAFYVNAKSLAQPGGAERVKAYADAGHRVGLFVPVSPSDSAAFVAAFKRGHEALSKLPGFFPSVRYPIAEDPKQDVIPAEVQAALAAAGYTIGYHTVSARDARMNAVMTRAIEEKKPINWDYLRDVYLRLHFESFQFYAQLGGVVSNNRAESHVLLLHENDITAHHLLGLIVQCRRMGIDIIPISEAFDDPVAQMMPKQSPQARLVGLALDRQGSRALYPERATDEGMDKMFEFFNAFTGRK